MSLKAVALPKTALKYVVAHELAHVYSKRHGRKFWKVMETSILAIREANSLSQRARIPLRLPDTWPIDDSEGSTPKNILPY